MTRLNQLLEAITKKHVYIQMHNYPDQDAISSAFGLQTLLELCGREATICYYGEIDKANTIKMVELLGIELLEKSSLHLLPDDEIILVDGQKGNVNMNELDGLEIACIDHHPMIEFSSYKFYDIRSEVGSCASIITEYFMENNIEIPKLVATALLYGIKIDTSNLSRRSTNLDIDMFSHLYKRANLNILRLLDHNSLQRKDLLAYQEAISTLLIHNGVGIAKIGDDCSEALIGSISDFLLTLEEVNLAVVYAYRVGGLRFSLRSESSSLDAGKLIKEALIGLGDGGGHSTMSAGFAPNVASENVARISKYIINRILNGVAM